MRCLRCCDGDGGADGVAMLCEIAISILYCCDDCDAAMLYCCDACDAAKAMAMAMAMAMADGDALLNCDFDIVSLRCDFDIVLPRCDAADACDAAMAMAVAMLCEIVISILYCCDAMLATLRWRWRWRCFSNLRFRYCISAMRFRYCIAAMRC